MPQGILRASLLCCLLLLGTGCWFTNPQPTAFVPMQATAAEQYRFAEQYAVNRNMALIPADQDKRFMNTREIVRQHFAKVVEYFPGDRFDTPLAKLWLLEMKAGLDSPRVKVRDRHVLAVVEELQALMAEYPELEFIQAKGMYDQALCYKRAGDFENASVCFHNVWKQHELSKNEQIKNLSDRARMYYNKTEVVE